MNLSVSNIAWPAALDGEVYRLLVQRGIKAIEMAPTRRWPEWSGISAASIGECRREVEDAGLRVSSLQSILYQKPQLTLFGSPEQRDALHRHLCDCADLAASLGAGSLVFGAPKNRLRGEMTEEQAFDGAVEFFARVAPEFQQRGVALVFEANPVDYGCDFATNSDVAERLVRTVASPGFRLHLDTACMHLAAEDSAQAIRRNRDVLHHFHVSEPNLGSFCKPQAPHRAIAAALAETDYSGWVALEMRAGDPPLPTLECARRYFQEMYGGRE